MRGQQGIGAILILIAIILASVIAAFLIIQSTDALRIKALNIQREHERMLMDRVTVLEVDGVVEPCENGQCIGYLLIKISLASGANPLDLRKLYFGYTSRTTAIQGIRYVPARNLLDINLENNACDATLINVMQRTGVYDITKIAEMLDPYVGEQNEVIGTFYTALWLDCGGGGDLYTLYPDQILLIFYRPKYALRPSDPFSLELGPSQGFITTTDLYAPRGFEKRLVKIYP